MLPNWKTKKRSVFSQFRFWIRYPNYWLINFETLFWHLGAPWIKVWWSSDPPRPFVPSLALMRLAAAGGSSGQLGTSAQDGAESKVMRVICRTTGTKNTRSKYGKTNSVKWKFGRQRYWSKHDPSCPRQTGTNSAVVVLYPTKYPMFSEKFKHSVLKYHGSYEFAAFPIINYSCSSSCRDAGFRRARIYMITSKYQKFYQ